MNRRRAIVNLAAALFLVSLPCESKERMAACVPFEHARGPRIVNYQGASDDGVQLVAPLFKIITLPERYDRKLVQTYGFLAEGDGFFFLYTGSEWSRYYAYDQAVQVIFEGKDQVAAACANRNQMVLLQGYYRPVVVGEPGGPHGGFVGVRRLRRMIDHSSSEHVPAQTKPKGVIEGKKSREP